MKKLSVCLITILMVLISQSYAYENTFEFPDKILPLIADTKTIHTVVKYISIEAEDQEVQTKDMKATTFHLGGGYFVALTHATEQEPVLSYNFGYGAMYEFIEILGHKFTINKSHVDLIGREDDISLFKALNYPKQKTSYKLGDSDLLKFGDNVVVIGNSFMCGINIKEGIISKFDLSQDHPINCKLEHSFMVTAPTNSGDSGSPLLAKQSEEYYLVGIVHATAGERMGYVFNINYVKDALKMILDKSLNDVIFIEQRTEIIIERGLNNP